MSSTTNQTILGRLVDLGSKELSDASVIAAVEMRTREYLKREVMNLDMSMGRRLS